MNNYTVISSGVEKSMGMVFEDISTPLDVTEQQEIFKTDNQCLI
jgi:hypothetical protein